MVRSSGIEKEEEEEGSRGGTAGIEIDAGCMEGELVLAWSLVIKVFGDGDGGEDIMLSSLKDAHWMQAEPR